MTRSTANCGIFVPWKGPLAGSILHPRSSTGRRRVRFLATALVPALILAASLPVGSAHAQRYHAFTYTDSDGLPSSVVFDVEQDHSGRMWFATRFGVAVYDGWEWTRFDVNDGLPVVDQRRVMCDHRGRIWTVGQMCRSAVFEDGAWTEIPTLGAGGVRYGLPAIVVPVRDRTMLLVSPSEGGVRYFIGDEWSALELPGSDDDPVYSMATDDEFVYMASDHGVLEFDPDRPDIGARGLPDTPRLEVRAVTFDRSTETLWIVGTGFIGRVRGGVYETFRDDVRFSLTVGYNFLVCEPDHFGGLYVGNPIELFRCDQSGIERLGKNSGLSGSGVTDLFEDREGNMWAATLRGATKFVSRRFANYSGEHGLQDEEVTAVIERRNGEFILGHPEGFTFLGENTRAVAFPRKTDSRVLDLAEDRSGNVWAAVSSHGLAKIDRNGSIEWVDDEYGPGVDVTSVLFDRNDRLWTTSVTNTFVEVDGRLRLREGGVVAQGSNSYLRRLFEGRDGTVYLISAGGVYLMRPGETQLWTAESPVSANNVYGFLEDSRGTRWAGTVAGLYIADGGKLVKAGRPGPRIDRTVYFITEDHDGRLWFGTGNGVMRWDGEKLDRFTREEGLVGRETNRAAGIVDSKGRVWIGMDGGVSVYQSEFDATRGVPPLVEFAGADVNGQMFSLAEELVLGPGQNNLIFHFRAMTFTDEHNVSFRSWLEGFDERWSDPSTDRSREIRYTNLPPGNYRFHMRAAGADGMWSPPVSTKAIVIDAPLWRKPHFIVAAVAAVLLALFAAVGYVVQHRYARRLEDQIRSRVVELRKVQDELEKARRIETLGVLAGGIAHDFNNLLTVMKGNLSLLKDHLKTKDGTGAYVNDAIAAANRARELTRQLLTFSRGGAPVRQPGSIANVIRESASFTMSGASVRCDIVLPDDLWVVDIDATQMSQVVNNLLLNAKEAMPAGGVIQIEGRNLPASPRPDLDAGRYVEITVEDQGEGIPPEIIDLVFDPYFTTKNDGHGLGLTTAYSIVKRHEGLLTLQPLPGGGTRCVIHLPASHHDAAVAPAEEPCPSDATGRILVMDDQKEIRSVAGKILTLFGHSVEHASHGAAAISLYQQRLDEGAPFDLVIMDLTVPGGMGGREAMDCLRVIDPNVKAIVASGYSNDPVMAEYASFGFCGRLSKPYSGSELARIVGKILSSPT